jgi:hypothetical protein
MPFDEISEKGSLFAGEFGEQRINRRRLIVSIQLQ